MVTVRDFLLLLPGIGVLILIGVIARLLSTVIGINHLIIAIALGIVLTNLVGVSRWAKPGVETQNCGSKLVSSSWAANSPSA